MKIISRFITSVQLLLLALLLCGCQSGGGSEAVAVSNQGGVSNEQPSPTTPTPTTASALLLFDISGDQVLGRISQEATIFRVQVFEAGGQLIREVDSPRTDRLLLQGLPASRVLIRTIFLRTDNGVLGYLDRFTTLAAGQTAVLEAVGFVVGSPPPGVPAFPSGSGSPSQLVFSLLPRTLDQGNFQAGVTVLDDAGSPVTRASGQATLSISSGQLTGNSTTTLAQGRAVFSGLNASSATGSVRLIATATVAGQSLRAESYLFAVSNTSSPPNTGVPATLRFVSSPSGGNAGQPLTPISVEVLDIYGQRVTASNQTITLTLANNPLPPLGAVLSGPLTIVTSGGLANFSGLALNQGGTYRLQASSTGLIGAVSPSFTLDPPLPPQPPVSGKGVFDALVVYPRVPSFSTFNQDSPRDIHTADFNGDGRLDLLAVSPSGKTIGLTLHPGRGDGTFDPATATTTTLVTDLAAVGDINQDGSIDVVATSRESGGVARAFLNDGSGVFTQQTSLVAIGAGPSDIVLADFNGDGRLDLATAARDAGRVAVALGNGDGTFGAPSNLVVTGSPVSLTVGDLDTDGDLDLATANVSGGSVTLLTNNGNGAFTNATTLSMGNGTYDVKIADLVGDSRPDLVTVNRDDDEVAIRTATGVLTYGAPQKVSVGHLPYALAVSDLQGDGRLDILTANFGGDSSTVLVNGGTGWTASDVEMGLGPIAVASGDFDGNGRPDFATANYNERSMVVRLNDGSGSFVLPLTLANSEGSEIVLAGDVDGDGVIDLVRSIGTGVEAADLGFMRGRGDGTFQSPIVSPLGFFPSNAQLVDLDSDGDLDLAGIIYPRFGAMAFSFNNGHGVFGTPYVQDLEVSSYFTLGDVDEDGYPDLATTSDSSDTLSVYLNDGTGLFLETPVTTFSAFAVDDVKLADFNGDDHLDMVYDINSTTIRFGTGDGMFGAPVSLGSGHGWQFAVGDLDDDEDIDFVTNLGRVFLNQGNGTFAAPVGYLTAPDPSLVRLEDMNGDDSPDLVTTHFTYLNSPAGPVASFTINFNDGSGTFSQPRTYRLGIGIFSASFSDLDGDGDIDLATAGGEVNEIKLFLNR